MARGAHVFFQYDQYAGSIAAVIWATTLRYNVSNRSLSARQWLEIAVEMVVCSAVAGPTGALVMLLWQRDIQAMEAEGHGDGAQVDVSKALA